MKLSNQIRVKHRLKVSDWQATIVLGLAMLSSIWIFTFTKEAADQQLKNEKAQSEINSLGEIVRHDIEKTVQDVDRVLKFLRRTYERSSYAVDWPTLIREDFAWNARAIQIAVIDRDGRMVASTAAPNPIKPIDLSDREHFKWHKGTQSDELFVSRPVIGRASGKWSIQFARKIVDAGGAFTGVLVVSMDPNQMLSTYERLEEFAGFGFALLGADDVIRAGAGTFSKKLGRAVPESQDSSVIANHGGASIVRQTIDGEFRLTRTLPVAGTRLGVLVSIPDPYISVTKLWTSLYTPALVCSAFIFVFVGVSVWRQRRRHRQIISLANTDMLTRLPNRLAFQRALEDHEATGSSFSLLLLDLDRFKAVNDTFGHPVGDGLLRAVAGRFQNALRSDDRLFRLGGDEFAAIIDGELAAQDGYAIARRLCARAAESFIIDGHRLSIGASAGIASTSQLTAAKGLRCDEVLKAADAALYAAKSSGRGAARCFDQTLSDTQARKQRLSAELTAAISGDELEMHYQPKVNLSEAGDSISYEALIRWNHRELGSIPPPEFIALAEESDLIVPLGNWIFDRVCRDVIRYGIRNPVAVNCSAAQLASDTLVAEIDRLIEKYNVSATQIEIEITESMLLDNSPVVLKQLNALRERGILVALDDFGTGYSSLSYLEKYPIDYLKIDKSFVSRLAPDGSNAVVQAIVALARALGMQTIAEGVETDMQRQTLAALGCDLGQGYLFSRPMAPAQLWKDGEWKPSRQFLTIAPTSVHQDRAA